MLLEILRNEILPQVQKPGQYLGLEWGAYAKDWDSAKSRMALIYPDLYELGMSNFGIKILYNIANQHPDYLCDRAYAVMPDMEKLLRDKNLGLWGWESYRDLREFDFLGFSLAYELCYSNIFTILDLCKIPFYSKDRDGSYPLIFAGGPAVFNPEPMADFFDFFIIGDGEELITEVQEVMLRVRNQHGSDLRHETLLALSKLQGIYVPRFYKPDPEDNHLPKPIRDDVPYPVKKRVTQYLQDFNQPVAGPVPVIAAVQDKQVLEIRRGCDRGCRFCQVGYTYLPVRERSPEDLVRLAGQSVVSSGYEDVTLLSLSASDYTCLTETAKAINDRHSDQGMALSMPSQRADRFDVDLADEISQNRKSGMTFAPEAGTEKLRRVINKGLSQEDIYNSIKGTYQKGWNHIKLYFMIGLPFEDDSDLDGILEILSWSINMSKQLQREDPKHFNKTLNITCTISTFVPKTFTAFQWFEQCTMEEFKRKQEYLLDGIKERRLKNFVKLNCTDGDLALIEAVLSRGDRRWGEVVKTLWQKGSRFDSWSENFKFTNWQAAAEQNYLDLVYEATRHREPGSKQCWDVISIGFTDKFLLKEWQQAKEAFETVACTENKCHACGVCFNLDVNNIVTIDKSDGNPFVKEISPESRQAQAFELKKNVENKTKQKLRLKITKLGDLRFIGHLDFQRLFIRALRRAQVQVAYSKGFNQRMKINWGAALPLFIESDGEYLEIDLAEAFDNLEKLKEILNQELPKQARIISVDEVTPEDKLSINNILESEYLVKLLPHSLSLSQSLIDNFVNQEQIETKRFSKGDLKSVDLKPSIVKMICLDSSALQLTLKKSQRADEVLEAFLPGVIWIIKRTSQIY